MAVKGKQIMIRLDTSLAEWVDAQAEAQRTPRSQWIRERLWEAFDAQALANIQVGVIHEMAEMDAGR